MIVSRPARILAILSVAMLAGCQDSLLDRSLIFATNTTLGIEVSVSPAETSSPVKLVMGYKRSEGVLNPVYHSQGVRTSDSGGVERYKPDAFSVIAKIASDAGANAGDTAEGRLGVAQWFATGEAAKLLARQPGIAGAVVGSSKVAEAAAKQRFGRGLSGDSNLHAMIVLEQVYMGLKELAKTDGQAGSRVRALNGMASIVPPSWDTYVIPPVRDRPANASGPTLEKKPKLKPASTDFNTLIGYRAGLLQSAGSIQRALDGGDFIYIADRTSLPTTPLPMASPAERDLLTTIMMHDRDRWGQLNELLAGSPAVVDAIEYYCQVLTSEQ